jgi:hypothetical protein
MSGSRSADLFAAGFAALEAARAESRVELLQSEARVARLRYVAELERLGRTEEAARELAAIRAEQEAAA